MDREDTDCDSGTNKFNSAHIYAIIIMTQKVNPLATTQWQIATSGIDLPTTVPPTPHIGNSDPTTTSYVNPHEWVVRSSSNQGNHYYGLLGTKQAEVTFFRLRLCKTL